jgi:hypothetical protein
MHRLTRKVHELFTVCRTQPSIFTEGSVSSTVWSLSAELNSIAVLWVVHVFCMDGITYKWM